MKAISLSDEELRRTDPRYEELLECCEKMNIKVLPGGLVKAKDAAHIIGVSEHTLGNQRWKGGTNIIPFTKEFGRIRYDLVDLARVVYGKKFMSTLQAKAQRGIKR